LRVLAYLATCCWVSCTPSGSDGSPGVCDPGTPETAALELDGGITAPEDGGNVALPVYLLDISRDDVQPSDRFCTGTVTSSSTILTAAHCVYGLGNTNPMPDGKTIKLSGVTVCGQRNLSDAPACSQDVFYDSSFTNNATKYDLAWIAFPIGTFTDHYTLSTVEANTGDRFLAVGFGPTAADNNIPTLRYGMTSFTSNDDGKLITSRQQNFENSSLILGDSGGPILRDCKIAGVASRETTHNEYVDLSKKLGLLRDASGPESSQNPVHFCGLSVVNNDELQNRLCPASGKHVSLHSIDEARQHFPCGKAASSTNPNPPDDPSTSNSGSESNTGTGAETAPPAACRAIK